MGRLVRVLGLRLEEEELEEVQELEEEELEEQEEVRLSLLIADSSGPGYGSCSDPGPYRDQDCGRSC